MRNGNSVPTVYLSGGLGNQLFQIAGGLQFKPKKIVINTSQINGNFDLSEFLGCHAHLHTPSDRSRHVLWGVVQATDQ